MNVLFIGNSFPPKIIAHFAQLTKGKNNLSCHNFEQSFIKGLAQQDNVMVKIVLVPWVGTYPISYTNLFVKAESYSQDGLSVKSIRYCNLIGINNHCRQQSLYHQLLKTFEEYPDGDIHVIIDTFKGPVLRGFQKAAKESKRRITQTVIMMDMPGFEIIKTHRHPLKKMLLQKDLEETMEMIQQSDSVIPLTKYFLDYFDKPMKHVVMEGLADIDRVKICESVSLSEKKAVLYTGTLMEIYGVMNLVDAFEKANVPDSELWICGSGDMKDEIINRAKINPKIKYLGLLTSEESWKKQREATVLVNPRTSEGEYTKYSFPSKTLEYLLAGRPVICNRLPGFPDEYAEYCIFPADESIEAMSDCIKKVLSMKEKERTEIGCRGKQFIIEKKNAKYQVGRIIEMLREE